MQEVEQEPFEAADVLVEVLFPVEDPAILRDIDTPEDYRALTRGR